MSTTDARLQQIRKKAYSGQWSFDQLLVWYAETLDQLAEARAVMAEAADALEAYMHAEWGKEPSQLFTTDVPALIARLRGEPTKGANEDARTTTDVDG
jgi:hypothetical protein